LSFEPDIWVPKLNRAGLSNYEARVYLSLLGEGRTTASKLIRKSGVPQPRVYQALGVLVEHGFAELILVDAKSKTYEAVAPSVAFARYRRTQERIFKSTMEEVEAEMRVLEQDSPSEPAEDPSVYGIRLVRGVDRINEVLDSMREQEVFEICQFLTAPPVTLGDIETDRAQAARGVSRRLLVERSVLEDSHFGARYRQLATEQIGELRWLDRLPMRLLIMDRKVCLLSLRESDDSPTLLIIPNAYIGEGMTSWFDLVWASAKTVAELPPLDEGSPDSISV
jgi:sugar-specific transcriptional regulator TrmB